MNFAWPKADLSKIIRKFTCDGDSYHVEYFDGSKSDYVCYNPSYAEHIKSVMLQQAKERQEKMHEDKINLKVILSIYSYLISTTGLLMGIKTETDLITILCAIASIVSLGGFAYNNYVKKELEKYLLFFKLYEHLDEVNKSEFMKCIEWENIYQKRLDIDTVDDFSLQDIKELYRNLEKKNETI